VAAARSICTPVCGGNLVRASRSWLTAKVSISPSIHGSPESANRELGHRIGRRRQRVQRGEMPEPVDIDLVPVKRAQAGDRVVGHEAVSDDLPPIHAASSASPVTRGVLSAATRIPVQPSARAAASAWANVARWLNASTILELP
jgi:hypothetical protein